MRGPVFGMTFVCVLLGAGSGTSFAFTMLPEGTPLLTSSELTSGSCASSRLCWVCSSSATVCVKPAEMCTLPAVAGTLCPALADQCAGIDASGLVPSSPAKFLCSDGNEAVLCDGHVDCPSRQEDERCACMP